jgi:hypothetical protein
MNVRLSITGSYARQFKMAGCCWMLVAICLAVGSAFLAQKTRAQSRSLLSPSHSSSDPLWYFHSDQWRADMRSLNAAIHFLLESAVPLTASTGGDAPTNRPACASN